MPRAEPQEREVTTVCDWHNSSWAGHCFGDVEHVAGRDGYGDYDYYACKRHHNLCIRKNHPKVKAR